MSEIRKPKFNFQAMMDNVFRKTIFLQPQPDGTLQAVNITMLDKNYYKDEIGATSIEPRCIRRVRGLKNVNYIALKLHDETKLLDVFDAKYPVVCPTCNIELWSPHGQMTEKMLADTIDIAESAGRLQAERDNNPMGGSKMNLLLFAIAAVGVLVLWLIMSGGAAK